MTPGGPWLVLKRGSIPCQGAVVGAGGATSGRPSGTGRARSARHLARAAAVVAVGGLAGWAPSVSEPGGGGGAGGGPAVSGQSSSSCSGSGIACAQTAGYQLTVLSVQPFGSQFNATSSQPAPEIVVVVSVANVGGSADYYQNDTYSQEHLLNPDTQIAFDASPNSAYAKFHHPASHYAVVGVAAVLALEGGKIAALDIKSWAAISDLRASARS